VEEAYGRCNLEIRYSRINARIVATLNFIRRINEMSKRKKDRIKELALELDMVDHMMSGTR